MNSYVILTDSSADLSAELLAKYNVASLPLAVTFEGEEPCPNDKIDIKTFYERVRAKAKVTTSAAGIDAFLGFFEPYLEQGKDILYLGFSSGLSGTYNAGFVAARELREKYPDRKILTVDTLCASLGQGLIVHYAAKKRDEGATVEEVKAYIKEIRPNLCHWFTVDDLFFLKRGGRVSAATAILGSMLQFKPVLHVDDEGHLINVDKVRGRKNAIEALVKRMQASAINPAEQTVFISHGDCEEDAQLLANRVRETMGVTDIVINHIGPVIGAHSGPGTLALFFIGKER
ncbi:MAG: DegV family protein [Clostridia bacterium]|nr:DegV family protein [Clostridia bacterium]